MNVYTFYLKHYQSNIFVLFSFYLFVLNFIRPLEMAFMDDWVVGNEKG